MRGKQEFPIPHFSVWLSEREIFPPKLRFSSKWKPPLACWEKFDIFSANSSHTSGNVFRDWCTVGSFFVKKSNFEFKLIQKSLFRIFWRQKSPKKFPSVPRSLIFRATKAKFSLSSASCFIFKHFFSSPDRETRPTSIEIFLAHFTSLPVDKRPSCTSDVQYWVEKLFVWITQKLKKFARKSEDEKSFPVVNLFYFSRLKLDRNLRDSDKLSAEFRLFKQNDEDPNNAAVVRWEPSDIIAAKWYQIDRHSGNSQH